MRRRSLIWLTILALGPATLAAQELGEEDSDATRKVVLENEEIAAGTVVGEIRLDGRLDVTQSEKPQPKRRRIRRR